MTYELAKQLKDAGFPQKSYDNDCVYITESESLVPYKIYNGAYCPTLSKLIEACGNEFGCLSQTFFLSKPSGWTAVDYETDDWVKGDTPEEAVAKLWLSLNKE